MAQEDAVHGPARELVEGHLAPEEIVQIVAASWVGVRASGSRDRRHAGWLKKGFKQASEFYR
jgi:hypothetical protein